MRARDARHRCDVAQLLSEHAQRQRRCDALTTTCLYTVLCVLFAALLWLISASSGVSPTELSPHRDAGAHVLAADTSRLDTRTDHRVSPLADVASPITVAPLFALANVRLVVQVTGLTAGATVQLWGGEDVCGIADLSSVFVYARRTVPAGAAAVTLDVPSCCTPAGVFSVCVRDASATTTTSAFTQVSNIVLADVQQSPTRLTLRPSAASSLTSLTFTPGIWTASAAASTAGSLSSSDGSGAGQTWSPLPYFCTDNACRDGAAGEESTASISSSASDATDAALTSFIQQLNTSFVYWDLSATDQSCLPATESYLNPQFMQANLVVTYNEQAGRWWVRAEVDVHRLLHYASSSLSTGSLHTDSATSRLTCLAPISSASTGTTAGSEYAGHTTVGVLSISIEEGSSSSSGGGVLPVPESSSSSSSSLPSNASSSSSSSSGGGVLPVPESSSSSSSSLPSNASSSSSSSSGGDVLPVPESSSSSSSSLPSNASSSSSSSSGGDVLPVPESSSSSSSSLPSNANSSSSFDSSSSASAVSTSSSSLSSSSGRGSSAAGSSGISGGSSSGSGGEIFERSPYPTSIVKGQATSLTLIAKRRIAFERVKLKDLKKVPGVIESGRMEGLRGEGEAAMAQSFHSISQVVQLSSPQLSSTPYYVSVVAADAACLAWLSVPELMENEESTSLVVPQCGAASPPGASSGASNSNEAADALAELRRHGTYVASNDVSVAFFCLAVLPVSASTDAASAEAEAVSWHALGSLQLLALYNCTTQNPTGIATTTIAPATPLLSASAFGVAPAMTNTSPWLSSVGGSAGCVEAANSASFTATQTALRTQGFLTLESTTPSFFVCVTSPDGTLIFTTATPTLTVSAFALHPLVAVWGLPQVYALSPRGVLPFADLTFMTFLVEASPDSAASSAPSTSLSSSSSSLFTMVEVSAADVARGAPEASLLLGDTEDESGHFISPAMIGVYRLRTFGTWITFANTSMDLAANRYASESFEVVDAYGAIASLVVLRPPVIKYVSYTEPSLASSSSSSSSSVLSSGSTAGGSTDVRYPARVPAGARVCATSYVPGNLYSQIPGEDLRNASYAAYRPYYYPSINEETSSSDVASSSSANRDDRSDRGMFLYATTPADWRARHAERANLCADASAAAHTIVYRAEEADEVCFSTDALASGPAVLYVVCAGTPAGFVEAESSVLTLTGEVTVSPSDYVLGGTTLVHIPQLPNTLVVLVPASLSLDSSSDSPSSPSTSTSAQGTSTSCDALTAAGVSPESVITRQWPHFTTNASGYGDLTLSAEGAEATSAVSAGVYTLCYWWPDVAAAEVPIVSRERSGASALLHDEENSTLGAVTMLSASKGKGVYGLEVGSSVSTTASAGSWVVAAETVTTYAPVFYSLSSTVLVAPLISTVALLQNLSTLLLLDGFYTSAACAERVPAEVLSWSTGSELMASSSASASSLSEDDVEADITFIEVNATAALPDAVFLCARVPMNDSLVPVVADGLRVVEQPFHVPPSTSDAPLSACREFDVYMQNSTGWRSGSYLRSVGGTEARVLDLQDSGLASLLDAMHGAHNNGTVACSVQLTLSLGACCVEETSAATAADTSAATGSLAAVSVGTSSTAYGVWIGAGTFGYLLNDTTLHHAAAAAPASALVDAGADATAVASDVRVSWSVCLTSTLRGSASVATARSCATVGRVWVGTASSSCSASGSASLLKNARAQHQRTQTTTTMAQRTSSVVASQDDLTTQNGVLPLVTSLAMSRVNVFHATALRTRYSTSAWLAIVAGSVLCGVYALCTPLVMLLACGVVRQRYNRRVKKLWVGYGGRESSVSTSRLQGIDEPLGVSVGGIASTPHAPATPSVALSADTTQRGTTTTTSAATITVASAGKRQHASSIAPHEAHGWWNVEHPVQQIHEVTQDNHDEMLVSAVGSGPFSQAAPRNSLTPAQLQRIEELLIGPAHGGRDALTIDLSLADVFTATSEGQGRGEATESPSPSVFTMADTLAGSAAAAPPLPSEAAQTLPDLMANESNARRTLVRAEEAAVLVVLEREQREWKSMVRGEGVRLRSLLMEDPYWAPRLAQLEVVNRVAMAAAEQGGGQADRSAIAAARSAPTPLMPESSEEDDSGMMSALSDSVRLYPLPRETHDLVEPPSTSPTGSRAAAGEDRVGSVLSDPSAVDPMEASLTLRAQPPTQRRLDEAAAARPSGRNPARALAKSHEGRGASLATPPVTALANHQSHRLVHTKPLLSPPFSEREGESSNGEDNVEDLRPLRSGKRSARGTHVDVALPPPPSPSITSALTSSSTTARVTAHKKPTAAASQRSPPRGRQARGNTSPRAPVDSFQVLLDTVHSVPGSAPAAAVPVSSRRSGQVQRDKTASDVDLFSTSSASTEAEVAQSAVAASRPTLPRRNGSGAASAAYSPKSPT